MKFSELTPEQRREMALRGVAVRAAKKQQTPHQAPKVCRYGHDLTADNLQVYTRNAGTPQERIQYSCRVCAQARMQRLRDRKKQRAYDQRLAAAKQAKGGKHAV